MRQLIKNLLERNSLFFAIAFSVLILILSLIKTDGIPKISYSHIDKVEHSIAYAVMTFFWVLSYQLGKIKVHLLILMSSIIVFGVIIEILQMKLTAHRTGDILDVLANSFGVIIGYFFFKLVNRIYLQV
ncbi:VanZ family protein [Wenyingzhuangia sp. IMCC45533]